MTAKYKDTSITMLSRKNIRKGRDFARHVSEKAQNTHIQGIAHQGSFEGSFEIAVLELEWSNDIGLAFGAETLCFPEKKNRRKGFGREDQSNVGERSKYHTNPEHESPAQARGRNKPSNNGCNGGPNHSNS